MKKNFKVIQLNGMTGLFLAITFVLIVTGSIICFPVYGIKYLWNYFLNGYFDIQTIRLSQAALLWSAILVATFGYLKSKIHFKLVKSSEIANIKFNNSDYQNFIDKIKEEQEENEKINR